MYHHLYDYGDSNNRQPQQGRSFVPYAVSPYQQQAHQQRQQQTQVQTQIQEAAPVIPPGSTQNRPSGSTTSYGYLPQQQQSQHAKLTSSLPDSSHGTSSYTFRQQTNALSSQPLKQQHQVSYNTLRQYNYSSMSTQDMALPQQQQQQSQSNDPPAYNPIDISSIVNGSGASNELPTTLPPLNSSILSASNSTQGSPIRNDHSQLSQGTPPLIHYQQQQQYHQQQQQQQQQQQHSDTIPSASRRMGQQQQQQQQVYDQPEFAIGISPYGCGVPGCFANFPTSSALFYHMKSSAHHSNLDGVDKPFRCAMPGCTKRYKNINGLQYHLREAKGSSGHGITPPGEDIGKNYRCDVPGCKKGYRTANGLRYHQVHTHSTQQQPKQQQQQQPLLNQHYASPRGSQQQQPPPSSPTVMTHHYPSLSPQQQQQLQQQKQLSPTLLNRHYHPPNGLQQQTQSLSPTLSNRPYTPPSPHGSQQQMLQPSSTLLNPHHSSHMSPQLQTLPPPPPPTSRHQQQQNHIPMPSMSYQPQQPLHRHQQEQF